MVLVLIRDLVSSSRGYIEMGLASSEILSCTVSPIPVFEKTDGRKAALAAESG